MIATIIKSSVLGLALGAALAYAAELPLATPHPDPGTPTAAGPSVTPTGKMTR